MVKERNYEFRKRLMEVHRPDRKEAGAALPQEAVVVDDTWEIVVPRASDPVLVTAARDLWDYMLVSMGVSLRLVYSCELAAAEPDRCIVLKADSSLSPGSYRVDAGAGIVIAGSDARMAAQGWYYVEDLMNLVSYPAIKRGIVQRSACFAPRMAHSGYGLDMFPDSYLARLAHLGIDSILVFTKAANETPFGYLDFNELINRAEAYGIDVYAYSFLRSLRHPDDPGAEDFYDGEYGSVFARCPGLKGIVMVGESVEFPSKDPHTTGRSYREPSPDGLPASKPSPGWWPCEDYPQWLRMIQKSVTRYKPDADIVFWTYNWGYVSEDYRLALVRSLPAGITLLATFEMFESFSRNGMVENCVDYTLVFSGPGRYFQSEAEEAARRGIRLYSMTNTGGMTWDIGVIPYEPAPGLWIQRLREVLKAKERWGLSGLMECHHYGLWPSPISELAKWVYWSPSDSPEEIWRALVKRDATARYEEQALTAWDLWSEGFSHYTVSNEDQYGPFRIGPAYPLTLGTHQPLPAESYAYFGDAIVATPYQPQDQGRATLGQLRYPREIQELAIMRAKVLEGSEIFQKLSEALTGWRAEEMGYLANMGGFIAACCATAIHAKQWYMAYAGLQASKSKDEIRTRVEEMRQIAQREIQNVENSKQYVESDSRLGWEPSMEYMADVRRLDWKIKATELTVKSLAMYTDSLQFS